MPTYWEPPPGKRKTTQGRGIGCSLGDQSHVAGPQQRARRCLCAAHSASDTSGHWLHATSRPGATNPKISRGTGERNRRLGGRDARS